MKIIRINNKVFLYLLSSIFFINLTLGQNDSLKIESKFFKHSILFNSTGLIVNEYRLTYKYKFIKMLSVVAEVSHKFDSGSKQQQGISLLQVNPLAYSNKLGNVGTRTDASLRLQVGKENFNFSQGIYYRHLEIDSVSYNNGAGMSSDNRTILYSEKTNRLGAITQIGIDMNIKLKSMYIVIEPYYRWLLLFPFKSNVITSREASSGIHSLSYIGINLGVRF